MSTVSDSTMQLLRNSDASGELVKSLERNHVLDGSEADALAHALLDIAEAINRVYGSLVPELLASLHGGSRVQVKDVIGDLREEFRHIDYHVHDPHLTDL
jgi:hypothetical protein